MQNLAILRLVVLSGAALVAVACVPHRDVPAQDVPKLTSLKDVMDVQATIADPQLSKIGRSDAYGDADFAAFGEVSNRILATSLKAKDFSKGPAFDKLADQLHATADALGKAAAAKDAKASSDALKAMKQVCKDCHGSQR